ncbi:P-loop containing nucleoside triphosphate hydrolase protein [Marasmius fiardii PR-910]|nr:P-loop containing nucleoside triphosphate hydrolase protein [Marasmius fiardii PR-910]
MPSLKIKKVDHYYSKWSKEWKYRNTSSKITVESGRIMGRASGMWKEFNFVLVRKIPQEEGKDPMFKIVIKSEYLIKACKDVIVSWPGISWNLDPLEVDPEMFLTFLEEFIAYRDNLQAKKRTQLETHILSSVNLLLNFLHSDFQSTIQRINSHKAHRETSFDLLYAILTPRSLLVTECAITGRPRLFKLMAWTRVVTQMCSYYQLSCESMDLVDHQATATVFPGKVQTMIILPSFKGTIPMSELDAYPLKYHADQEKVIETILARGKKWVDLIGVHHKEFDGIGALRTEQSKILRHAVRGRIMVDRATFKRFNPNYKYPIPATGATNAPTVDEWGNYIPPTPQQQVLTPEDGFANGTLVQRKSLNEGIDTNKPELTDEELLLTSTVVYGFSLSDKLWLEFDVEKINPVQWNQEAFTNLVLPDDRKNMLQALVEAHHQELGFDDFIKGKGHGLVVNLFGPPGVGKTFSAEATSEHVKRPLYLVGAGDLGTAPAGLDLALERVFEVATAWKAIVLIDEADVFLEQRSLHDLDRNAMVAVFLRHVEYYRGILFLTTNRVKAFDEAFLSRIHVALHFTHLPIESKIKIWTAFIRKVGALDAVSPAQIEIMAKRNVNGRQIKNAVRTAQSLAVGKGQVLSFGHFMETLDAMEEFEKDFEGVSYGGGVEK